MRNQLCILFAFLLFMGCALDEERISGDPGLTLFFSTDTVAFDTLLSGTKSSTRRLKVINPNASAIQFSDIFLGQRDDSDYSVIINGRASSGVVNEVLQGGDSLLILVDINVTPQDRDLPYLVKDSIVFEWNENSEHVKLVAYGQDGIRRANEIICNETWTNSRPHIVSDTLLIGPDCQLTIEGGAKIYFENDAAMFIQGTLKAIGDSANHIEFRNARFDGVYDIVPGQWNGIYFLEGSKANEIAFAELFNGQVGLRIGTPDDDEEPDVIIENTMIHSMSLAGLLAFTSDVQATNTLIYNCGTYLVGNFAGGNYAYRHCTFTNEPSPFVRDEASVLFSDNLVLSEEEILTANLSVELANTIIWGSASEELLINNGGGAQIQLALTTNIIKSVQEIENNFTSQEFNFPGFSDPFLFDYSLDTLAFAKDKATPIGIEADIQNAVRDEMPDIGAFERKEP